MTLSELKSLLSEYSDRYFRLALPDGAAVPAIGGEPPCCGPSGCC